MSKRKADKIDGHDPWEVEVAYWVEHFNLEPIDARALTVIGWMLNGDLRPLAAEIKRKGTAIDGAILAHLERMIDEGQLTVKRRRGAPAQPSKRIRDIFIAALHENRTGKSADAIQQLAKDFNISDELVRRAIKRRPT
jgi:hypothetical protein